MHRPAGLRARACTSCCAPMARATAAPQRGADHRAADVPFAGRGVAAPRAVRRPCAGMARAGGFLPDELRGGVFRRSALASTFAAMLELARAGRIELRQDRAFGPIYLRSPPRPAALARAAAMSERRAAAAAGRGAAVRRGGAARRGRSRAASRRRRPTSRRWCASLPRPMPGAASSWCGSPAAGLSGPRPISAAELRRERAGRRKLSRAAVETLAIIAYHEPVSRAEIEAIRGVRSQGHARRLMEAGWVRPAGGARRRAGRSSVRRPRTFSPISASTA